MFSRHKPTKINSISCWLSLRFAKLTARERQLLYLLSFIFLLTTTGWVLFKNYGALEYYNIRQDLTATRAKNIALEKENHTLRDEIGKLQNDPDYLEDIARRRYDMLKKNEMIFKFK